MSCNNQFSDYSTHPTDLQIPKRKTKHNVCSWWVNQQLSNNFTITFKFFLAHSCGEMTSCLIFWRAIKILSKIWLTKAHKKFRFFKKQLWICWTCVSVISTIFVLCTIVCLSDRIFEEFSLLHYYLMYTPQGLIWCWLTLIIIVFTFFFSYLNSAGCR